jgi:calcineurin-like phosphoesterase family protein
MIYFLSDCDLTLLSSDSVISNWNSAVKIGDTVYHIGDFTQLNFEFASSIIQKLNGEIHFLPGSNDYWMRGISKKLIQSTLSKTGQQCFFEPEIISVDTGYKNKSKVPIVLCHYPMTLWQGSYRGALHAFGHCRGNLTIRTPRSIDVSYNIFMKPININNIISWFKEKQEV